MARRRSRAATQAPPDSALASPDSLVTVSVSRPGCLECEQIAPALISDVLKEPGVILWVDIKDPGPRQMELLREEFGFHFLALEDVVKQQQRPKVDEYPEYYYVVMYAPLPMREGGELSTAELDMFVGKQYVVTCHRGDIPSLQEAGRRWQRTDPDLRKEVGFLLHVVADSVIDSYFPVVEGIEERLDQFEVAMFTQKGGFQVEQVLSIKRILYTLRSEIYPLREVFNTFLRRDQLIFSPETYPYFQDAYDHVLRLLDTIEIERDMATGALEVQLSIASNRLNETMKRLTVIAICVAVMGAVFGAWGMNFDEVPFHHLGASGFYILCGIVVGLVGVALFVARRFDLW